MDVDVETALSSKMSRGSTMTPSFSRRSTVQEFSKSRGSSRRSGHKDKVMDGTLSADSTFVSRRDLTDDSIAESTRDAVAELQERAVKEHTRTTDMGRQVEAPEVSIEDDSDLDLDSDKKEFLMSEEECLEWDRRITDMTDRISKQQAAYEQWEDNLNRRRLQAYGRMKNLQRYHNKRLLLYTAVENYVKHTDILLQGKTDEEKSGTNN